MTTEVKRAENRFISGLGRGGCMWGANADKAGKTRRFLARVRRVYDACTTNADVPRIWLWKPATSELFEDLWRGTSRDTRGIAMDRFALTGATPSIRQGARPQASNHHPTEMDPDLRALTSAHLVREEAPVLAPVGQRRSRASHVGSWLRKHTKD